MCFYKKIGDDIEFNKLILKKYFLELLLNASLSVKIIIYFELTRW